MKEINKACKKVLNSVEDAVVCGVIDLNQSKLIAVSSAKAFSEDQKGVITKAMTNLFQGTGAIVLAQMSHNQLKISNEEEQPFQEIQMAFEDNFYFAKTIKNGKAAIVLVTKEKTNIGMAWVRLRSIISIVEPLVN